MVVINNMAYRIDCVLEMMIVHGAAFVNHAATLLKVMGFTMTDKENLNADEHDGLLDITLDEMNYGAYDELHGKVAPRCNKNRQQKPLIYIPDLGT